MVNPDNPSGFQRAMIELVGSDNYRELNPFDNKLEEKANIYFSDLRPQIVFIQAQCEDVIDPHMTRRFCENGAYVINWTGDKRKSIPRWMVDLAPYVSCTAFSNMDDVTEMRHQGFTSEYLDIGYDSAIYSPEGVTKDSPEIVFMGNDFGDNAFPMSKMRREIVQYLDANYGNRFGVFGRGWDNSKSNMNDFPIMQAATYRAAKVAINCNHFDCERYNSDRLLRILGCEAMCLSYKHREMEKDFEEGTHLAYFSNLNELGTKLNFYLEHEEDRRKIAKNGQLFVRNNCTFGNMVLNIFKLAES